jgi:predicted metal-dependent peptidase
LRTLVLNNNSLFCDIITYQNIERFNMSIKKDAKDFLVKIQQKKDSSNVKNGLLDPIFEDRKNVLDLNIAIGLDVSGSISRTEFNKFMAQMDAIKGLSRVKVIEIDTKISAMYDYYKTSQNRIARLRGGGGTQFAPAFQKFKELRPDAILFMTDGDCAGHVDNPGIPTGWIMTNDRSPPYGFGEVIVRLD